MNLFDQLLQAVMQRPVVDLWNLPLDLDWRDPVVLSQVKAEVQRTLLAPGDAHDMLVQLVKVKDDQSLAAEVPKIWRGWQEVIDYLNFIALLFLKPGEVEQLFKTRLLFALQESLEVQDIVHTYLAVLGDDLTKGEQRQLLISALRSNEERLGQRLAHLVPLGSTTQLVPAVKNWLSDYEATEAGKESRGAFERSDYLTKSKNVTMLGREERGLLTKIIKLYDFLRFEPALLPSLEFEFGLKTPPVPAQPPTVRGVLRPAVHIKTPTLPRPFFIQTVPAALKKPEPAFFFNLADEEEVDRIREQMATGKLPIAGTLEQNLRLLAEEVIAEHNFQFKDEVNRRRFVNLFVSFMKDVRDVIEVREALLKSQDAGGLGLTSDKTEAVIGIFKQVRDQLPQKLEEWNKSGSQRVRKSESQEVKELEVSQSESEEVREPPPQLAVATTATPVDQLTEWRQELLAAIARAGVTPPASRPVVAPVKLVDVKAPPRVFGPIEELKAMTLVDFRRLGPTAAEVSAKILAKIQLISETGIGRRLQAVRAWQASPVHQLYLAIGGSSIEQAKSVADIITEHQAAGLATLTMAEFEAMADLNTKLRF